MTTLALGACDGDDGDDGMANDDGTELRCADESRADAWMVGLSKTGERHTVSIVEAEPATPVRGDNTWTVMVTDTGGAAMEGMAVDVKPWMPDHGHGTAVEETVSDLGAGEYELTPLNLHMAGYWEVTIELSDADGGSDSVMFGVCVE